MRRRPFVAGLPLAMFAARAAAAGTAETESAPQSAAAVDPPLGVTHRALRFPADHGAHPDTHVEWWYVTGWLARRERVGQRPDTLKPEFGFQVTFFRTRTGLCREASASRFAARQLVFAHVALTDLEAGANGGGLLHDQRAAREGFGHRADACNGGDRRPFSCATGRCNDLRRPRRMRRPTPHAAHRRAQRSLRAGPRPRPARSRSSFKATPAIRRRAPIRGRPATTTASRSWRCADASQRAGASARDVQRARVARPRMEQRADARAGGRSAGTGSASTCSTASALMAFRLRRADGSALWAGGSLRERGGQSCACSAPSDVRFEPLRRWTSPRTQAELSRSSGRIGDAGRALARGRAAGRPGTRQPRVHRLAVLGGHLGAA